MKSPSPKEVAQLEHLLHEAALKLKKSPLAPSTSFSSPIPDLARAIDQTLLRPDATLADILALCRESKTHRFASVCVHSHWLPEVCRELRGSQTLPIAVVGFPHGSMLSEAKAAETKLAIRSGAREIDMVVNLGRLKSHQWREVFLDIRQVIKAARKVPVKVIIETSLLTDEEKIAAAVFAEHAGAAFVKTSTGYSTGGATLEDVVLLRRVLSPKVRIKASGGIKTREFAEALLRAGADRLGTSSGATLLFNQAPVTHSGSY